MEAILKAWDDVLSPNNRMKLSFPMALMRACLTLLLITSLSGCLVSSLNPPSSSFTPVVEGLAYSSRDRVEMLNSAAVDTGVYTRIGSVETSLFLRRCDSDVGEKGCIETDRTADDAMTIALNKAKKSGGDAVVVKSVRRADKFGSRQGACQAYTTTQERVSTYKAGDSSTSSTTKTVNKCTRYEQIRTRSTYHEVVLDVYRAEQGLAERMDAALAAAALDAQKAQAEKDKRYAAQAAAAALRRQEAQAAKAEKEAFMLVLRKGNKAEVAAALGTNKIWRSQTFLYPHTYSFREPRDLSALHYAIAHLNVDAVRALLAAGADPNGSKRWKASEEVPPPLWFSIMMYRKHNACANHVGGKFPDGFISNYRVASGQHKADAIFSDLIAAGADASSAAPRSIKRKARFFGAYTAKSHKLLRTFGYVAQCQPPTEQANLLRKLIDAGGYDRKTAAETLTVLREMADYWENVLLPDWQRVAEESDKPEDREFGKRDVAMRRTVIAAARSLIAVLMERAPTG